MQSRKKYPMTENKTLQTTAETTQHIEAMIRTTSSVAITCTRRRALTSDTFALVLTPINRVAIYGSISPRRSKYAPMKHQIAAPSRPATPMSESPTWLMPMGPPSIFVALKGSLQQHLWPSDERCLLSGQFNLNRGL